VPRRLWPAEVNARVAALEAVGCRVNIQRLESPWAHVCLVAAQHEAGHFTTMGTAADVCFLSALTSALSELESRVYAWLLGHHPSISTPAQARSTEHHFELYGLKPYYRRADNVLFAADARIQGRWPSALHHKSTQALIDRFAQRGLRTVAVDITPRHHCIDQGRQTLVVVKALVPGLLPISFGHGMEPEGMVPRVHPAARFPHPFP
jgi:ribosomal protein S12 methylthiotransferase accessory factor